MFTVEMLPAQNGDCLWIEYGKGANRHRILIDGGRSPTYQELARRIHQLDASERHFELLVVTHVDSDHIQGIIPLLQADFGITYGDVWFNGWKQLAQSRRAGAGGRRDPLRSSPGAGTCLE